MHESLPSRVKTHTLCDVLVADFYYVVVHHILEMDTRAHLFIFKLRDLYESQINQQTQKTVTDPI